MLLRTDDDNKSQNLLLQFRTESEHTTSPPLHKGKNNENHKEERVSVLAPSTNIVIEKNDDNSNYKELQYVLTNYLAFSNVHQVPLSQLHTVNSTISELTQDELRNILETEPSIGIIKRKGKDAIGKPLEEEYYYDMENDSNEERKMLVTQLKGERTGLRTCRKRHKQYFWKKPTKK